MIRTVVLGAAGRMGRTLVAEIQEDPELELAGALEAPQSPFIGVDAGALAGGDPCGVKITADIEEALKNADCLIDFTAGAFRRFRYRIRRQVWSPPFRRVRRAG